MGIPGVHPVGEITDRVLDAVFADISVHLPLVDFSIDWRDWERAWAYATGGRRLGSNKRLVDVVSGDVSWSMKSMEIGFSSSGRVHAITSRLDVTKHRGVADLLSDVDVTGRSALEMWNEKIALEHSRSKGAGFLYSALDLRLIVVGRIGSAQNYVFHERQLVPENVVSYAWSKNASGNIEGHVGKEHRATFLLNGFKLVLHYDLRRTDPHVTYVPPKPMSVEEARKFRQYDPIRIYRESSGGTQLALSLGELDDD